METLHIILQGGYDKAAIARWEIPYVNKKQKFGVSIAAGVIYNKQANYTISNNKPVYHGFENMYAKKNYFSELGFSYRASYNSFHNLLLSYNYLWFNDSLLIMNPDLTYGANQYNYLELYYKYKLDYRDYAPYPLNGYYFDVQFNKIGFGLFNNMNFTSIEFNFDQYFTIYKRFYFAYRLSALITNKNKFQPYLVRPGIEIDDFDMRGYELYVINGQELGMFKSNFKFEIIPMKTHRIKWIKSEKFGKLFYALYANLFFDAAYAYDRQTHDNNPLGNQLLWSTGLGIDFVTFYDIVIRVEYSINKQKDTGLYVGLVAPI
jgi:outer membrane protein assembly factor BamA